VCDCAADKFTCKKKQRSKEASTKKANFCGTNGQ
jgi:hypothetical protein